MLLRDQKISMNFLEFNIDIITSYLAFVDSETLCAMRRVNTHFSNIIKSEINIMWKEVLRNEFGCTTSYNLPSESHNINDYYVLYCNWREYFEGYHSSEIKLANLFWTRYENWCEENFIGILQSLNPPASNELINQAEKVLKCSLPRYMKLLYKFHNGQNLLCDCWCHNNASPEDHERSMGLGMFGGVNYYDQFVCVFLLSLQSVTRATTYYRQYFKGNSVKRPQSQKSGDINDDALSSNDSKVTIKQCVVFATSADGTKFYCIAPDVITTKSDLYMPHGAVYANTCK
jgi:hypothetical protein